MTEQEKNQYRLKKENEIERLQGFLDPVDKRFITDLELCYSIKREQDKVLNEMIWERFSQLRWRTRQALEKKISSFSEEDLKKIWGIYWQDGEKTPELLNFIMETSFSFGIDGDGQSYVLAGCAFTPPIKMEDIIRREIANSTEELIELLDRVSSYLEGIAKIEYQPIDETTDEFRINYDISGLIHENAKLLQN